MKVATARTFSKFDRSVCKRDGQPIYRGDPVFLWEDVWVCGGCNDEFLERGDDWIEALFMQVPSAYRATVFRALALAFHPDHGAESSVMKRLLDVRERWEQRVDD